MNPEQSRAEQRRSRGGAQESWTDALGEQDSRFGQRNGLKDSPESGRLAEVPEGRLIQTAELSLEQSRAEQRRAETLQRGGTGDVDTYPGRAKVEVCTNNGMVETLAEAPERRLTQTAGLSLEQNRADQR